MIRKIEMSKHLKIVFVLILFLFFPLFIFADSLGQRVNFYVDKDYDLLGREKIYATLKKISQRGYFYLEDEWYENLDEEEKEKVNQTIEELGQEFDKTIYPQLTSVYGSEWAPGIDNDYHVTILIHQIKENHGGYFNSGDEFPKSKNPNSNEREMVYINTKYLFSPLNKSLLSHEFTHLITFNQKDRLRGVSEDTWLNEGRAEYSPTLLGYDEVYQGSNLQQRVKQFINFPSDSLLEWQNQDRDYGALNLFIHYLVDYYGIEILADSMKSSKTGIASINEALKKHGFKEDFSQIFTDWTITTFLNNCNFGEKYCYKNKNLSKLKVSPTLIFLPTTQKTEFSLDYAISQWSGHWYRIIGGKGNLKVGFDGNSQVKFKVPYVLCKNSQNCSVSYLSLDENQKGDISIKEFGNNVTSLTLIPSIQSKMSGFNGAEILYSFSISASLETQTQEEKELIEQLLAQIAELQAKIAETKAKIAAILAKRVSCQRFDTNLYYGMVNNLEVKCLQQFLKSQGPEIYPEGLVTGNFLSLTKKAVIRFQEKYASEILAPLGLEKGTGFVGPKTRAKINQLLGF